jgi:hypothetical protein
MLKFMSDNVDPGISLLTEVTEAKDLNVKTIDKSKVPKATMAVFTTWANSVNIPVDSAEIYIYLGTYSKGKAQYYVFDVSGDDPDQYRGSAIIQDGKLVGSSLLVGN